MKLSAAALVLVASTLPGSGVLRAQQPSPSGPLVTNPQIAAKGSVPVYVSAADLARSVAAAVDSASKSGTGHSSSPLISQPPIQLLLNCDLRPSAGARIDDTAAELYRVVDGSGTMTVGGKLLNPTRVAEGTTGGGMSGTHIEGGTPYKLHAGDILMVPANSPQAVTAVEGRLVMLTATLPIGDPGYWPMGNGRFADMGDPNIYISAADVKARMERADGMIRSGLPDRGPFSLLSQPPYHVTMDDRLIPNGHIDVHPFTAELFVVLDGAGTVAVGGNLIGLRGRGNDMMAPTADAPATNAVHKGDIVLIPINAGHAVSQVDGKLTMMQVHIPPPPPSSSAFGPR